MKTNQKLIDRLHNVDNSVYEAIMGAIKNEVRIDFDAIDAKKYEELHYEMYPFLLKRDGACFLYGFSASGELCMVFIESIRHWVKTTHKAPNEIWNDVLMERCRCSVGSTFLEETPRFVSDFPVNLDVVVLKVDSPYSHAFRLYPFHFSQETVEENEVYCIFRYYLQPTKELVLRILEHGDKVEVLSPLTLRDETKEMIKKMLIRYSQSG